MLEQPQLWLPNLNSQSAQEIRADRSGSPLGFAQWVAAASLFSSATLEVREIEDSPLLFQAQRTWTFLRRYKVLDSEDHLIGYVQQDAILAPSGREVVWCLREKGETRYHQVGGPVLATESTVGEGRFLRFTTDPSISNPFLRMLIVASWLLFQVA